MAKILVVDDEKLIVKGIRFSLEQDGMEVDCAYDGEEAINLAKQTEYDVVLLDVMLPKYDGFEVCQAIREFSEMPVIMLTAKGGDMDKILGLEYGADDYITKPFRIRELLARMKAILRRTSGAEKEAPQLVTVGKNQVNLRIGKVYCGNEEVLLTAMEYRLLLIFLNHRGQVLSRGQILDQIWDGAGEFVNDNTLTVYVGRLRKKLGDTEKEPLIETVRGAGYRLRQ